MRPAKIQISLRIRAVWSEPPLGAFRIANDAKFCVSVCVCVCVCVLFVFFQAETEVSDQTAWMRKLIWVFLVFLRYCSFHSDM